MQFKKKHTHNLSIVWSIPIRFVNSIHPTMIFEIVRVAEVHRFRGRLTAVDRTWLVPFHFDLLDWIGRVYVLCVSLAHTEEWHRKSMARRLATTSAAWHRSKASLVVVCLFVCLFVPGNNSRRGCNQNHGNGTYGQTMDS